MTGQAVAMPGLLWWTSRCCAQAAAAERVAPAERHVRMMNWEMHCSSSAAALAADPAALPAPASSSRRLHSRKSLAKEAQCRLDQQLSRPCSRSGVGRVARALELRAPQRLRHRCRKGSASWPLREALQDLQVPTDQARLPSCAVNVKTFFEQRARARPSPSASHLRSPSRHRGSVPNSCGSCASRRNVFTLSVMSYEL